jgi:hypothetical protein
MFLPINRFSVDVTPAPIVSTLKDAVEAESIIAADGRKGNELCGTHGTHLVSVSSKDRSTRPAGLDYILSIFTEVAAILIIQDPTHLFIEALPFMIQQPLSSLFFYFLLNRGFSCILSSPLFFCLLN